jgi:hypothetical protein
LSVLGYANCQVRCLIKQFLLGGYERRVNNKWQPANFHGVFAFQCADGTMVTGSGHECEPIVVVEEWQLECPSIIFVRLKDDNAQVYNFIKLMSNIMNGVQSQCFVSSKYESQRTKDQ